MIINDWIPGKARGNPQRVNGRRIESERGIIVESVFSYCLRSGRSERQKSRTERSRSTSWAKALNVIGSPSRINVPGTVDTEEPQFVLKNRAAQRKCRVVVRTLISRLREILKALAGACDTGDILIRRNRTGSRIKSLRRKICAGFTVECVRATPGHRGDNAAWRTTELRFQAAGLY